MPEIRRYPQLLRRPQASAYLEEVWGLQFSPGTLAKLCCQGLGPATTYDGRRAYHAPESLDSFAKSRINSTKSARRQRSLDPAALHVAGAP